MRALLGIFILTLSFSFSGSAQTVLFEDKAVVPDTIRSNWGPNSKHFIQGTFGFAWPVSPSGTGAPLRYFVSGEINLGIRYRRQWASWFSTGAELKYNADIYRLKQIAGKTLPDSTLNDKERIGFQSFQAGLFLRFNLGKRGDRLGTYLDVGPYGDLYFISKHRRRNDMPNGEREIDITRRLEFAPIGGYGVRARIGIESFLLTVSYRISDLLDDSFTYPQLPRWKVGMEFAF